MRNYMCVCHISESPIQIVQRRTTDCVTLAGVLKHLRGMVMICAYVALGLQTLLPRLRMCDQVMFRHTSVKCRVRCVV